MPIVCLLVRVLSHNELHCEDLDEAQFQRQDVGHYLSYQVFEEHQQSTLQILYIDILSWTFTS